METGSGDKTDPHLYLIILEEAPQAILDEKIQPPVNSNKSTETDARIVALKQELLANEEYLESTREELETTNEELKSSNEEMQSVNEELQSTNEELETSKEELQSTNEELATVNAELQTKVNDLTQLNNDMNNLLSGTGIGTIFVDFQLNILRFTSGATGIINLIKSDVGRPVSHIVSNLVGYNDLIKDIQAVLATLVPKDMEVQTTDGKWFSMRIQPYRTIQNVIEGAVISFFDITQLKFNDAISKQKETIFNIIQHAIHVGGWDWDVATKSMYWTKEVYHLYDLKPGGQKADPESIAKSLECYLPEDQPVIQAAFQRCVDKGEPYDLKFNLTTSKNRQLKIRTYAEPKFENNKVVRVTGFIMDITVLNPT